MNPHRRGEVAAEPAFHLDVGLKVRATMKSDPPPKATGRTAVPARQWLGNAGAPAVVGVEGVRRRLRRAAQLQRLLVPAENRLVVHDAGARAHRRVDVTAHATPARGPKLFLSMLNCCVCESGASARPVGILHRGRTGPRRAPSPSALTCQSSCTNVLYRCRVHVRSRDPR